MLRPDDLTFDKGGRALTDEERANLAKRRGLCVRCGIRTHEVRNAFLRRIPLNNENVYNGTCIRCFPSAVPSHVAAEWDRRNRAHAPITTAHVAPVHSSGRGVNSFRNAANAMRGLGIARASGTTSRPPLQAHGPPHGPPHGPQPHKPLHIPHPHPNARAQTHPPPKNHANPPPRLSPPPDAIGDSSSGGGPHSHRRAQSSPSDSSHVPRGSPAHSSGSLGSSLHAKDGSLHYPKQTPPPPPPPPPQPPQPPQQQASDYLEDYTGGSAADEDIWQVVKALQESRHKPEIVRQKLHRLRNLVDGQAGAIYEVKDIMDRYKSDSKVMALASGAVWGITSKSVDNKVEAADAGAIDCIIDSLRANKGNDNLTQWALGSLSCLAMASENIDFVAGAGAIESILDSMKANRDSAGVFEWGCRALFALVYMYEDDEKSEAAVQAVTKNIVSIEENNGIARILSSMERHSTESVAQLWAFKLLWRLLDRPENSSIDRVVNKIIAEQGVATFVRVMKARSTSVEVYSFIAALLSYLLPASGGDESAYRSAIECVTTTVRMMGQHPEATELQESCCRLLTTLGIGPFDGRRQLKEAACDRTVVEVLSKSPDKPELIESLLCLLWAISSDSSPMESSVLGRALRYISEKSATLAGSKEIGIAASGFIANACRAPLSVNVSDIPTDMLVDFLLSEPDSSRLFEEAARAIVVVSIEVPEVIDAVVDAGCIEKLMNSLSSASCSAQGSISSILTAIVLRSEQNRQRLMDFGCLAAVSAVLKGCGNAGSVETFLTLISSLTFCEKIKVLQLPTDIIQNILGVFRQHLNSDESRQKGLVALRNAMLVSVPNTNSVVLDGFVDLVSELINSESTSIDLKKEACGALWAYAARQQRRGQTEVTKMLKSILGVMEAYKGEQQPYHSEIQSIAGGALVSVSASIRDNPIPLSSEDVDIVISILYTVMEFDLDRTELFEKILDAIFNLSTVDELTLIQCGVIVVVIDSMVEHETNESIQERGCAILALLSSTENLQVNLSIAETDGIDMIVSALAVFSGNQRIQTDACKALSHLSIDQESRMLISSQGGLILLVNAMKSNNENVELLEAACSALLNLTSDAEEEQLQASNVVEVVVEVMRYQPDSAKLQEKGLGVLQNVSMRSAMAKNLIADAGGIDAVKDAIREFMGSPGVLERAFTTMWSLAVLKENQVRIADVGGINLVVNGMMANIGYERVQKQACGCLCTLSSNSENKALIRDEGGIDSIVYAMWAHFDSDALQTEACRALSSLAVNIETNEVMIASEGEINAIISAMRRFPRSEKLQEHGCVALRNFLLSAHNAPLIRSNAEEVRILMNRAATTFPNRCAERARQVLANLG